MNGGCNRLSQCMLFYRRKQSFPFYNSRLLYFLLTMRTVYQLLLSLYSYTRKWSALQYKYVKVTASTRAQRDARLSVTPADFPLRTPRGLCIVSVQAQRQSPPHTTTKFLLPCLTKQLYRTIPPRPPPPARPCVPRQDR